MKIFLTALLLIFILFIVLLLGNMLRCMMARGEACPLWCQTKPVQCLSSECQTKLACQAPGWPQYSDLLADWWSTQLGKLK